MGPINIMLNSLSRHQTNSMVNSLSQQYHLLITGEAYFPFSMCKQFAECFYKHYIKFYMDKILLCRRQMDKCASRKVKEELQHTHILQAYFSLFLHMSFRHIRQHLFHQGLAIVSVKGVRKEEEPYFTKVKINKRKQTVQQANLGKPSNWTSCQNCSLQCAGPYLSQRKYRVFYTTFSSIYLTICAE